MMATTTHFLIMLVVMSLSVWLFLAVVLSTGVVELVMLRCCGDRLACSSSGDDGTENAACCDIELGSNSNVKYESVVAVADAV